MENSMECRVQCSFLLSCRRSIFLLYPRLICFFVIYFALLCFTLLSLSAPAPGPVLFCSVLFCSALFCWASDLASSRTHSLFHSTS
ncbi:hypothetical protein P167DRAFT_154094 [Morchella conica CCBAS932]|uniref:Uncharacterized protein n=1 Tax=Morchella conica CCBAS932 TaxID=1392247 RepID=A0A3N4KQJ2_9PEZI|nr:hypothetical protein P167DRAFT_154094 [Morchella conica CCBAS932]